MCFLCRKFIRRFSLQAKKGNYICPNVQFGFPEKPSITITKQFKFFHNSALILPGIF